MILRMHLNNKKINGSQLLAPMQIELRQIVIRSMQDFFVTTEKKGLFGVHLPAQSASKLREMLCATFCAFVLFWGGAMAFAENGRTGFLVVAADRGFLGNQEIRAATVREDWPELREKAVGDIRNVVQDSLAGLRKRLKRPLLLWRLHCSVTSLVRSGRCGASPVGGTVD